MGKSKSKEVLSFVAFLSPNTDHKTIGEISILTVETFVSVAENFRVGRGLKALCKDQLGSI